MKPPPVPAKLPPWRDGAIYMARKRLVALRGARSQRAFAKALRVSYSQVQRFEAGGKPGVDLLIGLGEAGVRLDWLLFGDPPKYHMGKQHGWETVSL